MYLAVLEDYTSNCKLKLWYLADLLSANYPGG